MSIDAELELYADLLGRDRPEVQRLLRAAARSADGARIAKNLLRVRCRRAGLDPHDDDPYQAALSPETLGGEGNLIGATVRQGLPVVWREEEKPYGLICCGAPGGGKTTFLLNVIRQSARRSCAVVPDLRGDYECLCRCGPNVRFFFVGRTPMNFLKGPGGVPPAVFYQRFAEVFTDQFDQRQAGRRYLSMVLDSLDAKRRETGHWPCLLDLHDALQARKEARGSDELRFRNRCLARVDAVIRALGSDSVGVERGIDLEKLINEPGTLVFRLEAEASVADWFVDYLLAWVFECRTWSENKFSLPPLIFVLDEQRRILRPRSRSELASGVSGFELRLTRARALGISLVVAEQVVSEISRAVRVSTHLVAAFRTTGTELRATAELLGLRERRQVERLQSLPKGECIVRLPGDRCPHPLHVRVPLPAIDRSNLTAAEHELYERRSLEDLLPGVVPRYEGYAAEYQAVREREKDPNRLSRKAWEVFVSIARKPWAAILERCAELHMDRSEEEAARRECKDKGYIREAGTLGKGFRFFELTAKGKAFAAMHNIPFARFKSGVVHHSLNQRIKRALGRTFPGLRFLSRAAPVGSVQPDAYAVFPDGRVLCVQVCCSNKHSYEVNALVKLCSAAAVDLVLVVARTKKDAAALKVAVEDHWVEGTPRKYLLLSATDASFWVRHSSFCWTNRSKTLPMAAGSRRNAPSHCFQMSRASASMVSAFRRSSGLRRRER